MSKEWTKEEILDWIKCNFPCTSDEHFKILSLEGWCPVCGMAADNHEIRVKRGDMLFMASPYAFVCKNRLVFYREALEELGLIHKHRPADPSLRR